LSVVAGIGPIHKGMDRKVFKSAGGALPAVNEPVSLTRCFGAAANEPGELPSFMKAIILATGHSGV
jgi:hypothetical protein